MSSVILHLGLKKSVFVQVQVKATFVSVLLCCVCIRGPGSGFEVGSHVNIDRTSSPTSFVYNTIALIGSRQQRNP